MADYGKISNVPALLDVDVQFINNNRPTSALGYKSLFSTGMNGASTKLFFCVYFCLTSAGCRKMVSLLLHKKCITKSLAFAA